MPARRIHVDMAAVAKRVEERCQCDPAVGVKRRAAAQARFDARWKKWLSQYDDQGHMRPGILYSDNYIRNMSLEFLRMSSDEQAAFIVSEKRRMGLL